MFTKAKQGINIVNLYLKTKRGNCILQEIGSIKVITTGQKPYFKIFDKNNFMEKIEKNAKKCRLFDTV